MARGLGPQVTSVPSHLDGLEQLTKAPNASSSFLLPFSRLAASCPDASWRCRHLRAAFLPRLLLLGAQRGGHTALPELFPGRSQPPQGPGSGRHFHCIQLWFSSLMIVSRTHPDSTLIQPLEFSPHVLRWVPRSDAEQDRVEWVQAGSAVWLVVVLSPAPSPLKRTMLSYSPLLPLLTGWRCLSAVLFAVLTPTGQHQNPPFERQKPRKILSKQLLPVALPEYLSLGWPEPSRGKAVVLSCEQVPKPSACGATCSSSHPGSHLSIAPWGWPYPPCTRPGEDSPVTPALGGRAEQLLLVSLSPLPVEKGTLSAIHESSGERHC